MFEGTEDAWLILALKSPAQGTPNIWERLRQGQIISYDRKRTFFDEMGKHMHIFLILSM